jgi:hypothetical protein
MLTDAFTRRGFAFGLAALPLLAHRSVAESALPKMVVNKDPGCGCCGGWIAYLRAAGFSVDVIETSDVDRARARLGVPADLASCHTAEIGGYAIEGHVPETAIRRLLAERPPATGIAVPGMPQSAPGMDVAGAHDVYDVILFGPSGRRRYARLQGLRELPA